MSLRTFHLLALASAATACGLALLFYDPTKFFGGVVSFGYAVLALLAFPFDGFVYGSYELRLRDIWELRRPKLPGGGDVRWSIWPLIGFCVVTILFSAELWFQALANYQRFRRTGGEEWELVPGFVCAVAPLLVGVPFLSVFALTARSHFRQRKHEVRTGIDKVSIEVDRTFGSRSSPIADNANVAVGSNNIEAELEAEFSRRPTSR